MKFAAFLVLAALLVAAVVPTLYESAQDEHAQRCRDRWARSGLASDWNPHGCFVEVRPGQWILEKHVQLNSIKP